ncbi:putative NAD(P)H nitroreductase MhqN [Halolactibacillus miurensis]|uniref:NAD(P)H nitroreductase MhqN n=1 Tax=Halolactibacillus miurensis TaxID=306541 RepID=A0A1I6S5X8_9BACI|nr:MULTISPECIES: nitroreductase family protein [Halolactibacillus]GEM04906.1 putative NAD(P)H nitroreductase MhqN [Halolactibacillus miurensis]SFS72336.1 putative NAD(P)H nitroreductase [Halolactibacillus miurensis]
MTEFQTLIKERRSASNFVEGYEVTQEALMNIFEIVKYGPSAFNLQHTHYITVLDPSMKKALKEAANNQHKVQTASAVIIVTGSKIAHEQAGTIYEGLHSLGILNKQEYDLMVSDTVNFYHAGGEVFKRDEAIRNGSLSAMLFMLAAKDQGFDTCPMIGFDQLKVKELLEIDDDQEVVMMITLGKEKVSSRKPRGYRKPTSEYVTFIK